MKKRLITGGLFIIGLISIGYALDNSFAKDNLYIILGFGLGMIIFAFIVLNNKPKG